jgi:hypothetical protein
MVRFEPDCYSICVSLGRFGAIQLLQNTPISYVATSAYGGPDMPGGEEELSRSHWHDCVGALGTTWYRADQAHWLRKKQCSVSHLCAAPGCTIGLDRIRPAVTSLSGLLQLSNMAVTWCVRIACCPQTESTSQNEQTFYEAKIGLIRFSSCSVRPPGARDLDGSPAGRCWPRQRAMH